MGQNGDWKEEGYQLSHTIKLNPNVDPSNEWDDHDHQLIIYAHDKDGRPVGYAKFNFHPSTSNLYPAGTEVQQSHRRKGIATAMYLHAEKIGKKKISKEGSKTADSQAMWTQKDRLFGRT